MSLKVYAVILLAAQASAHFYKVTDQVYFDVYKGNEPIGRVVIGLFGESAPKSVQNFIQIATNGIDGKSYAGTRIHRIIKRFMIQGGDIMHNNGSGSVSVYGDEFEDENLNGTYDISGLISMASSGKDKNGCQFFITTIATPWLNGIHTIFGKVVDGQNYIHLIEHYPADNDGNPEVDVWISASGTVETTPYYISDQPYDLWAWLKASTVPLTMSFSILAFFHWMIRKMDI